MWALSHFHHLLTFEKSLLLSVYILQLTTVYYCYWSHFHQCFKKRGKWKPENANRSEKTAACCTNAQAQEEFYLSQQWLTALSQICRGMDCWKKGRSEAWNGWVWALTTNSVKILVLTPRQKSVVLCILVWWHWLNCEQKRVQYERVIHVKRFKKCFFEWMSRFCRSYVSRPSAVSHKISTNQSSAGYGLKTWGVEKYNATETGTYSH